MATITVMYNLWECSLWYNFSSSVSFGVCHYSALQQQSNFHTRIKNITAITIITSVFTLSMLNLRWNWFWILLIFSVELNSVLLPSFFKTDNLLSVSRQSSQFLLHKQYVRVAAFSSFRQLSAPFFVKLKLYLLSIYYLFDINRMQICEFVYKAVHRIKSLPKFIWKLLSYYNLHQSIYGLHLYSAFQVLTTTQRASHYRHHSPH